MLAQFRDLFNGLAPRQRITLVAVSFCTLAGLGLMVSRSSSFNEESLLSGKAFGPAELEQARRTLHKRGLFQFRVEEQRIVVPRDLVQEYNRALVEQAEMPGQFGKNWEEALDKKSLLPESDRQLQERLDLARAKSVVEMICKYPQIADASIAMSNARQQSTFGKVRRTAILSVTPRNGAELSSNLYQSFQRIVAGAWNMAEQDITIFNTNSGQTVKDPNTADLPRGALAPPQETVEMSRHRPEMSLESAVPSEPASASSAKSRSWISSDRPLNSRTTAAFPIGGDSPLSWAAPAGGALFALVAWGVLKRIRRRTTKDVKASALVDSPRSAEELPESSSDLSERPSEFSERQRIVIAPEAEAEISQPSPTQDDETSGAGLELPAHPKRSSPRVVEEPSPLQAPFRFLHEADPDCVLSFVTDEHPQTIALILSHLPGPLAAKVLKGLPSTKQLDVGRRVVSLEETDPEILQDVAKGLRNRIASTLAGPFGAGAIAPRLSAAERIRDQALLESLEREDSALAHRIRRLMFVFDDLLKLDGSAVASLFARVDCAKLALALKGASDELKSKILDSVAPSAAARLHEELDDLGPVRLSDVAAAQQQIVALVRRLEDAGEIVTDTGADALRIIA